MKSVKIKIKNTPKIRVRSNLARSTMVEKDKKKEIERKKKNNKFDAD